MEEIAQRKSKVKLNFGLSPDFSVQLKVSLSESLSERLSQMLVTHCPETLAQLHVWYSCSELLDNSRDDTVLL